MRVGMVGCGKLGLMVALTIESKGHEVKGYDVNPLIKSYLQDRAIPFQEEQADELLSKTKMEIVSLEDLCTWADILFLAPQTPHDPKFDGTHLLPTERRDFDYKHLFSCVMQVDSCLDREKVCVVISTVLPGTMQTHIIPFISDRFKIVYEPLFIAMGTVYKDFLNPEFVLVGVDEYGEGAADTLAEFYKTIHSKPLLKTDIKTAEGIKVFYNTFITAKTVLANFYGEMAERLGMNVDDIYEAICLSTDRLLSPKYLKAGMGDGGGCHPRDNIALSFVSQKIGSSFDLAEAFMLAREKHAEWLARIITGEAASTHTEVIYILGRSFKPETNIESGSPSILVSNILNDWRVPHSIVEDMNPTERGVYFIGTQHQRYRDYVFPIGSTVIDPFRYLVKQDGVKLVRIGLPRESSVPELCSVGE